jgi:hypothetical protein
MQRVPISPHENVVRSPICKDSDCSKGDTELFSFEEDISPVLQAASQHSLNGIDWIADSEDDGNDKKPKAFNLRRRLMILLQPVLAKISSKHIHFSVKDVAIIVLFVSLLWAITLLCSKNSLDYDNDLLERNRLLLRRDDALEAVVKIPQSYEVAFVDVSDTKIRQTDTPLFFHIPRSAGITVQDVLSHCWNLVEASQVGTTNGHHTELELKVWRHEDGGRYVNVDTTTLDGIERAKRLRLIQSGLADVLYSTYLNEMSGLFSENYRARVFTMIRNPISRAVSMYSYLQEAVARGEMSSAFLYQTIEDYAQSPHMENNLLTRLLVNQMEGPLKAEHMLQAKEILRRKVLVGLTTHFKESLERFKFYFGWQQASTLAVLSDKIHACEERLVNTGDNKLSHANVEKGSQAWQLLAAQNIYDLQLYDYAQFLFQDQGRQLFVISEVLQLQ